MYMSVIKTTIIKCPACETTFESHTVEAVVTYKGRETDFRVYSHGEDPLLYYALICPHCNYAAYSMEDPLDTDLFEFVRSEEYLRPMDDGTPLDFSQPSTKHVLIARILERKDLENEKIAREYLSAAWLARSSENFEDEKRYQKLALKYFQLAQIQNEISEDQINIIIYLIGEINRRIGEFHTALDFFSKVDTSKFDVALLKQQIELAQRSDQSRAWYPQRLCPSPSTTH